MCLFLFTLLQLWIKKLEIVPLVFILSSVYCPCYLQYFEILDGTFNIDDDYLPELYGGFDWNEVVADVRALDEIAKRRRTSRFEAVVVV